MDPRRHCRPKMWAGIVGHLSRIHDAAALGIAVPDMLLRPLVDEICVRRGVRSPKRLLALGAPLPIVRCLLVHWRSKIRFTALHLAVAGGRLGRRRVALSCQTMTLHKFVALRRPHIPRQKSTAHSLSLCLSPFQKKCGTDANTPVKRRFSTQDLHAGTAAPRRPSRRCHKLKKHRPQGRAGQYVKCLFFIFV